MISLDLPQILNNHHKIETLNQIFKPQLNKRSFLGSFAWISEDVLSKLFSYIVDTTLISESAFTGVGGTGVGAC